MHLLSQVRQICDLYQFGPYVDGREDLLRKLTAQRPTGSKNEASNRQRGTKTHFTGSVTHTHIQSVQCILSRVHQNVVIVVDNDKDDNYV